MQRGLRLPLTVILLNRRGSLHPRVQQGPFQEQGMEAVRAQSRPKRGHLPNRQHRPQHQVHRLLLGRRRAHRLHGPRPRTQPGKLSFKGQIMFKVKGQRPLFYSNMTTSGS